jgi:hypothetical protein
MCMHGFENEWLCSLSHTEGNSFTCKYMSVMCVAIRLPFSSRSSSWTFSKLFSEPYYLLISCFFRPSNMLSGIWIIKEVVLLLNQPRLTSVEWFKFHVWSHHFTHFLQRRLADCVYGWFGLAKMEFLDSEGRIEYLPRALHESQCTIWASLWIVFTDRFLLDLMKRTEFPSHFEYSDVPKAQHFFFVFIWFVRLLALRPLLAYCATLGW